MPLLELSNAQDFATCPYENTADRQPAIRQFFT
ncbi:hypothetical protein RD1_2066 [Roseobacter denitrificans OCh 114]|uniref:Uncharacterized protein n=1 Tax=Roseobacter denitrificans (strain ATCC 33942 / OCh 114) TaxID=375451 RepID=Q168C5_ROSDO|nr:hypothetical protein RD1_2066 [Roseobacter denitrificans OCh 114]